jgi:hypothetical protein
MWEANTKATPQLIEMLKTPLQSWPTVYSGMDIIVNRLTPRHYDAGGADSFYDHLVGLGQEHNANFLLPDFHGTFAYQPGTSILFSGAVLAHECPEWNIGERIVIAHYTKDEVQDRLQVARPALPTQLGWLSKYS